MLRRVNHSNKINYIRYSRYVLAAILFCLICGSFITPYQSGDGQEYMLMTQAFQNHLSPNVTTEDIKKATAEYRCRFSSEDISDFRGFFESYDGKSYSYHFWLYSLFVLPFKLIIKFFQGNQLGAFYFCNVTMFLSALLYGYFKLRGEEYKQLIWLLLIGINPILFYITWTHAEVFTYSLTCISLIMFYKRNYKSAIFTVSVAAMQNQPIVFLGGLYFIDYCVDYFTVEKNKFKIRFTSEKVKLFIKPALITACSFIPFFIPLFFYYINYGTISLIASKSSQFALDWKKISSLFFDLNYGMMIYIPIALILFFVLFFYNFFVNWYRSLLYGIILFFITFICSLQRNWNPGIAGINRYSVWIVPILFYFILFEFNFKKESLKRKLYGLLTVSTIVTGLLVMKDGFFVCNQGYLEYTPISRWVMENFPQLYNPQEEIFYERYVGAEGLMERDKDFYPSIISKGNFIKKIYLKNAQIEALKQLIAPECWDFVEKKLKLQEESWYYINFPFDHVWFDHQGNSKQVSEYQSMKMGRNYLIKEENRKFELNNVNMPGKVTQDQTLQLNFNLNNSSDQVFLKRGNRSYPFGISYHIYNMDNSRLKFENEIIYFDQSIFPGESVDINMQLDLQGIPKGKYKIMIDCVQAGYVWFHEIDTAIYVYEIEII